MFTDYFFAYFLTMFLSDNNNNIIASDNRQTKQPWVDICVFSRYTHAISEGQICIAI